MTEAAAKQQLFDALALLKDGQRDEAAERIARALEVGPPSGEQWKSIAMLAGQIGEVDLSIEAGRRFASTPPVKLSRLLQFWRDLIGYGRGDLVEAQVARHNEQVRDHPSVIHILGQLAAQNGEFDRAMSLYRQIVGLDPYARKTWFSIAMITDMEDHPDWIERMKALAASDAGEDVDATARLFYALGKAHHDLGDHKAAFSWYRRGGTARKSEVQYQPERIEHMARRLIDGFTREALAALTPPTERPRASIFVNGLPRSGTTLVEQILVAHSAVDDGAEVSLARAALIPTLDHTIDGARRVEERAAAGSDPWGNIARQYERMLGMRFRTDAIVVDKTLTQSHLMGLIVHAMPDCPMIWLRRNREDVALSCFRTFFTSPLPWCWDFASLGHFMAIEDALFDHWNEVAGERLLTVPYEELVKAPERWVPRIAEFAGLPFEEAMMRFHEQKRTVRTASLQQVRQPISTAAIGQAQAYSPFMADFHQSYDTTRQRFAAR